LERKQQHGDRTREEKESQEIKTSKLFSEWRAFRLCWFDMQEDEDNGNANASDG
jgi:hypothetical protein